MSPWSTRENNLWREGSSVPHKQWGTIPEGLEESVLQRLEEQDGLRGRGFP